MRSLPINLRVAGRSVVVVGGGRVAARRAAALLDAGANLRIVAPSFGAQMRALRDRRVTLIERRYERTDLNAMFLAVAATSDDALNREICSSAQAAGVLCCNAGNARAGDVTFPASSRHGRITVSIDTGGASPVLAKRLLDELSAQLDPHASAAAQTLASMRSYTREVAPPPLRREVLRELAALPLEALAQLSAGEASKLLDEAVSRRAPAHSGPGDSIVCATRGSKLALAQAAKVVSQLEGAGINSHILTVATHGDLVPHRPFSAMNAENIFVKEIETALLDGRAQYAVHSCKDLPSTLDAELELAAIAGREDARDAFCSARYASFDALPSGARVGTSSVRRRAQLMALRDDLQYAECRGNVDTRLRKLREGQFDALILAMAGLVRLQLQARYTVPFEFDELVPAVGQGALAIEMRAEPRDLITAIRRTLNDERAELAVVCERAALAALGGGCNAPVGIHARWENGALHARGVVCSPDGSRMISAQRNSPVVTLAQALDVGHRLANQLRASGAIALLEEGRALPLAGRRIVLPRTRARPSRIAQALEDAGARVLQVHGAEEAAQALGEGVTDMLVFPSSGAVETLAPIFQTWRDDGPRPAIAALGPASAHAAAAHGVPADVVAAHASVESLLAAVQRYFESNAMPSR